MQPYGENSLRDPRRAGHPIAASDKWKSKDHLPEMLVDEAEENRPLPIGQHRCARGPVELLALRVFRRPIL